MRMVRIYYHTITVLQISIMDTPLAPDMDREREMMMELQVGRVELDNVQY